MPDGYRSMPLPALAVFSGVLSKVAAYGFLRIALPLFPEAAGDWQLILLILSLLSIVYGSVQAFTQTNLRLILGYSSIAQLGFITLGIFALVVNAAIFYFSGVIVPGIDITILGAAIGAILLGILSGVLDRIIR
jgi:NADH:ubiquinone oxidoreductase subunit 4 (subunit M)